MSESALLRATRDHLIARCGLKENQCIVEPVADYYPPTSGLQYHVFVVPGSINPGEANRTSGGVLDQVYGLDVAVAWKIGNVPRDRVQEVFLYRNDGMEAVIRRIVAAIHFDYDLMNKANDLITDSPQGFIHPLVYEGMGTVSVVDSAIFDGRGENVGLMRRVTFGGARRIQYQETQA